MTPPRLHRQMETSHPLRTQQTRKDNSTLNLALFGLGQEPVNDLASLFSEKKEKKTSRSPFCGTKIATVLDKFAGSAPAQARLYAGRQAL